MISFGLKQFARGLRRSNPLLAASGLALLFLGWLRRQEATKTVKLYSTTLAPGEELHFTMTGPEPRRRR
jgi:hypothetical protein